VLARILDRSEFDEFKPAYGEALVTGWGELHGHPVCMLAHTGGQLSTADEQKAAQFLGLAAAPLVVLENAAGSTSFLRAGAHTPHVVVTIGAWPAHRLADPRFQFSWPNARPAGEPAAAAALTRSGRVHDDGVIDPRDTRTVLGFCLSTLDIQTGEDT
jgi:acyl-CoA carboxylase subunit beta